MRKIIFIFLTYFLNFEVRGSHDLDFMKFSRESGLEIARRNLETASQNIAGKIKEYRLLISEHKPQGRFLTISGVGFFEIPQVDGTLAYARRYSLGGSFKEKLYSFTINDAGCLVVMASWRDSDQQNILPVRVIVVPNPNLLRFLGNGLYEWTEGCGDVHVCDRESVKIDFIEDLYSNDAYENVMELTNTVEGVR